MIVDRLKAEKNKFATCAYRWELHNLKQEERLEIKVHRAAEATERKSDRSWKGEQKHPLIMQQPSHNWVTGYGKVPRS